MSTTTVKPTWDRLYKFVLVGDTGVGKSCYIKRLIQDEFADTYTSTIGVDFMVKTYNIGSVPKEVKIQVWDTAGRQRFRTITSSYWRGAHGIIFVYDVTNRTSFEHLPGYYSEFKKYAPETAKCILIGTKTDLEDKRAVTEDEGQKVADSWNAQFAEVSAKTGTNVEDSFLIFLKALHEHLDDILSQPSHKTTSTSTSTQTPTETGPWWKRVLGLA